MADRTLRSLARQFAKGELDKDNYRRSRAAFVEGVLSGEIPLQVNEYPAPRALARADRTTESTRRRPRKRRGAEGAEETEAELEGNEVTSIMTDPTPPRGAQAASPDLESEGTDESESSSPLPYIIAAVVGAVLIGILVVTMRPSGTEQTAPAVATTTESAPAQGEAAGPESSESDVMEAAPAQSLSQPASDLILQFLADKNWSDAARTEFLNQWQALPEEQRAGAAQSGEMAQLNNSIYKKLQAERALSGLGDAGESLAKQRALVEFAAALGIQDPRLTVPSAAQQ